MATRTIAEESGARPESASPISSVWMPRKLTAAASDSLDLIRALAACAVMVGHVRALFFVDFRQLAHKSWPLQALYFLTGFGHQAVIVFFVLSGFLISSTVIRSYVLGKWSWRDYAVNRATRLYVVLIPGLLLGFFWDRLGSWLFAAKGIYARPLTDLGPPVPLQNLTPGNFLGNLFFLQTIFCDTFGSNAPLWSLANEFWYYVLFPVALAACLAWVRGSLRVAIPLACLAIFIGALVGRGILIGFLIWLAGCGLVLLYTRVQLRSRLAALSLLCLATALSGVMFAVARVLQRDPVLSDLEVGFVFTLFLFAVLQVAVRRNPSPYSTVVHRFAGFSYSLYVLHFPFVLFFRTWLVPVERWQPTPAHLLCAASIGAGSLLFAWLVSLVTEAKTDVARTQLNRLFG
ncbi:MAG TPA: acyltransferase [Candidatus Baltobacteraceae bacterium]|nr:acyltransferase [Candidatus Baltobacteraceae bacterium]